MYERPGGTFVGGQLVGSSSRVATNEYFALTGVQTNHFDDTGSGFGGGLNFGYNWMPWGNSMVAGVVFVDGLAIDERERVTQYR